MRRSCLVHRSLRIALAFAALAASATAQSLRWTRDGTVAKEEFGSCLAWLPDRDGDGVDEIVASAPGVDRVRVVSGRGLALLLEVAGDAGSRFGTVVVTIADLDGDGARDLAIGAPAAHDDEGVVRLVSSRDGSLLRELRGGSLLRSFGAALADLGDLDGDGASELAVGAPGSDDARNDARGGNVDVVSSADGRLVASRRGLPSDRGYGWRLSAARDLDGDGARDLATIAWRMPDGGDAEDDDEARPCLELRSGRDLAEIRVVDLSRLDPEWRATSRLHCLVVGDADGDGFDDVAVSDPGHVEPMWNEPFDSRLWVLSGASGELLRQWHATRALLGDWLGVVGDADGDGLADLAVSEHAMSGYLDVEIGVAVRSIRTGARLRLLGDGLFSIQSYSRPSFGAALLGGRDLDGDRAPDLVVADTGAASSWWDGRVATFALRDPALLAERTGEDRARALNGAVARFGDADGDAIADLVVGEIGYASGSAIVVSGADGSLLRRLAPPARDHSYGDTVAPLPDLDGDGVNDFAIGGTGRIEVHSGAGGAPLHVLTDGLDGNRVLAMTAGVQPDGSVHLAAGTPAHYDHPAHAGTVTWFDLSDGSQLLRRTGTRAAERFGGALAFLGDVNGDGTGDWAVGAPESNGAGNRAGRVVIVDGANGKFLKELLGSNVGWAFGQSLAAVDDVTGDSIRDLLIGIPGAGNQEQGRVTLYAGKTWGVVVRSEGEAWSRLGEQLATLGDVNGDGRPDFATTARDELGGSNVAIGTAGSDRPLGSIRRPSPLRVSERDFCGHLETGSPWLPNAATAREIAFVNPSWSARSSPGANGRLFVHDLPELFLEITPRHAAEGEPVRGDVHGAPPAVAVGILVTEIDGVPYGQFISLGFNDAFGDYLDWSIVPPGLTGSVWKLRAFATGFAGQLVESSAMELTFQ